MNLLISEQKRLETASFEFLCYSSQQRPLNRLYFQANMCDFFLSDSLFRAALIELSVMMKIYCVCVVEYSSH